MHDVVDQAMIFAAGRGERLWPLTDIYPKPLISLNEKNDTALALHLRRLAHFSRIVVNTHHLASQIHKFCVSYPNVKISHEESLLDTAGGICQALPLFDVSAPILILNGDIWIEESFMLDDFLSHPGDLVLGLIPVENAIGYKGLGDYRIVDDKGHLVHRSSDPSVPYIYSGIAKIHPRILQSRLPVYAHSLRRVFDENRPLGVILDTVWCDIGTVSALNQLRSILQ